MIITTPIIFNNVQNYRINKLCKKNHKPFVEREGDWICNNCKNLNFAFRKECNRCQLPKGSEGKKKAKEEDKIIEQDEKNCFNNNTEFHNNYNHKYKNNFNHCNYNKSNNNFSK